MTQRPDLTMRKILSIRTGKMTCEELEAIVDAAYTAWMADPSPANMAALQAAQGAWAAEGCNLQGGPQGGGVGDPPGGGLN